MILRGRTDEAFSFATEAHTLAAQNLAQDDSEYVLATSYLAAAMFHGEKDEAAGRELLEGVAESADVTLADLPGERDALLNNLAVAYQRSGQPARAIPWMERVVASKAKRLGDLAPELLENLQDLVMAYDQADRFGEAEDAMRHMVRIFENEIGTESREYLQSLRNLQACLNAAGKKTEAAEMALKLASIKAEMADESWASRREQEAREAYRAGNFERAKKLHHAVRAATPEAPLPGFMTAIMGDVLDPLAHFAAELDTEGVEAEGRKDWPAAIRCYRAIVEIFRMSDGEHRIKIAQALNNLALAYQGSGDFETAREYFTEAVAALGPLLPSKIGQSIVTNVVALYWAMCDHDAPDPSKDFDAAFARLGESARSKGKDYARSLRARFPLPDPNDDRATEMRKWIDARMRFYLSYGSIEPVRALHEHLLGLHELLFAREPRRILDSLISFIGFCMEHGPASRTRALLDRAEALSAEVLEDAPLVATQILHKEARFRATHGDNAGAEDALLSARELLAELAGHENAVAVIEADLLVVWLRMGKQGDEMDELLDRTIAEEKKNLRLENPQAVQHLAGLLSYRKDWDGAESLSRQALAKLKETVGEWDPQYGLTVSNLGNLLRMRGRAAEAVPLLRQAVKIRELEFGTDHQAVSNSRLRLALALGGTGRWEEAVREMEVVLRAGEFFLQSTASVTSRGQLYAALQQERAALDVLISIALRLSDPRRAHRLAYEAILRRKGLGAEALAARRQPLLQERHPEQRAAFEELDQISSLISEHLVSSRHNAADLKEAQTQKRRLEAKLAAEIPELRFDAVWRAADAAGIQQSLEEACVLIEYAQFRPFNFEGVVTNGDPEHLPPRYLGFVIARDAEIAAVDLGGAAEIDEAVTEFGKYLAGEAGEMRHFVIGEEEKAEQRMGDLAKLPSLRSAGERVRKMMWDPLFPKGDRAAHVMVAPDGLLGLLPFDLLPVGSEEILLDQLLVSNLGSGRDIIRLADRTAFPTAQPAIFCAPDFDLAGSGKPAAEPQREFLRGMNELGLTKITPLPGAEREGREIQQLLPGSQLYAGPAATESAMRSLRSPLVLHVATHGFSTLPTEDTEEGEEMFHAGLVFAGANTALRGGDAGGSIGDSMLTGEEAATLNLQGTELVVLSACRSGLGKAVAGEGLFGLHRAFASAGARCVITSLWKIPDAQTTDLMTCLYQELRRGKSRAAALREAKLRMKARHPHPFFWGSFLCHGDWQEIPQFLALPS